MTSLTAISHLMQVNSQLEELRIQLNEPHVPLTNETILTLSSQLQPLYKKLLITNLDDALGRQLEVGMWSDCFKAPLTRFGRTDKHMFHIMIETGVGFYLGLIQDIGIHFDISFITNTTTTNKMYCTKTSQSPLVVPSKASVYYIIQNCLLHVGDLLRYRGDFPEAIKMYDKSAAVCPTNGQPYHQMGITQTLISGNDDYTTMNNFVAAFYFHSRALAVANPYLQSYSAFDTITSKVMNVPIGTNKYQEFLRQFILMVAAILRKEGLPANVTCSIIPTLTPLVTNQQIKPSLLFQMICIALWTHWRILLEEGEEVGGGQSEEVVLEILVAMLNAIVIGAVTLFDGKKEGLLTHLADRQYASTVHLKLLVDWLARMYQNEKMGKQIRFIRERVNCANLVKLLNLIKTTAQDASAGEELNITSFILPEEKRLIGFLPLDYSSLRSSGSTLLDEKEVKTQMYRMLRVIQTATSLSHPNSAAFPENPNFTFVAYEGLEFQEASLRGSSPSMMLPSKRNVALTSIFWGASSPNQNQGGCMQQQQTLPTIQIPSLTSNSLLNSGLSCPEYTDPNTSFGSSFGGLGGLSPSNSATSLSPRNVSPFVVNTTPGVIGTPTHFLQNPGKADPFKSIWTPDETSSSKPDSAWN